MPLELDLESPASPAIGIDLGTTFCCLAVFEDGEVKVIRNNLGKNTTPSYVAFVNNRLLVGDVAKDKAHEQPQNTVFDVKRLIGRRFEDVQNDIKFWPFDVHEDEEDGLLKVHADGKALLPEEISKELLAYLKNTAEERLGCKITQAVVTVPAYFNNHQRQLTIQACSNAGLKILQLMTEPTAAAVAYNLHRGDDNLRNALIYDLGGGTFDVAVLSMTRNFIRIKSLGGDTRLGGEDFDRLLVDHCIREFEKLHGTNLAEGRDSENPQIKFKVSKRLRRIKKECEKQKCFLSQAKSVVVSVDAVFGELDLAVTVPRPVFEGLIQEYLDRSIKVMEKALEDAEMTKEDIEDVVLIGGSSRIPRVEKMLGEYFQKPLYKAINADEAVAAGAAIQAYYAQLGDLTGIAIEQPNKKDSCTSDVGSSLCSTPYDATTPLSDGANSCDTSPPQSTWSSSKSIGSINIKLKNHGHSNENGETRQSSNGTRRLSRKILRSLSEASFLDSSLSAAKAPALSIGIYIDEDQTRVVEITENKFDPMKAKPLLEPLHYPPVIAIKDRLYTGKDADKYKKSENYYRILDLVTKPTNKICQLTDSRHADCGILFEEELIGAFLRDVFQRVKKNVRSEIGSIVLAMPFVMTSAQRERLKIAAVLAKIPNTRLYSSAVLTTVAYANLRKSFKLQNNFAAIQLLVLQYGHRFFSAALVQYSPEILRIKNYFSSYSLLEEQEEQFLQDHPLLLQDGGRGLEGEQRTKVLEMHRLILEKACPESERASVDFGCLICNQNKSELLDSFINQFVRKTIYTFDECSGPLSGASVLAAKAFTLGETAVFDAIPGTLQCLVKQGQKSETVFNERNDVAISSPGVVFDHLMTLGVKSRGAVIMLKEVLADRVSEICTYRLTLMGGGREPNNNNGVSLPLTCQVDEDALFHLLVEDGEVEEVEFFRTDKLNSDVGKISNRIQSFNAFYKSLERGKIWKGLDWKGTVGRSKGKNKLVMLDNI